MLTAVATLLFASAPVAFAGSREEAQQELGRLFAEGIAEGIVGCAGGEEGVNDSTNLGLVGCAETAEDYIDRFNRQLPVLWDQVSEDVSACGLSEDEFDRRLSDEVLTSGDDECVKGVASRLKQRVLEVMSHIREALESGISGVPLGLMDEGDYGSIEEESEGRSLKPKELQDTLDQAAGVCLRLLSQSAYSRGLVEKSEEGNSPNQWIRYAVEHEGESCSCIARDVRIRCEIESGDVVDLEIESSSGLFCDNQVSGQVEADGDQIDHYAKNNRQFKLIRSTAVSVWDWFREVYKKEWRYRSGL